MNAPRLRLLGAPTLLAPTPLTFLPERRFRLAAVLALSPQGATRDELATLFWPERPQAAARSNFRKLVLELRRLELPALVLEGPRLCWDIGSDARDLADDAPDLARPAPPWAEPLAGLDGGDSAAFDDWLHAQRQRLTDAWTQQQRRRAQGRDAPAALAAAQALLDRDPNDADAQRLAARARLALGGADTPGPTTTGGRRHDDTQGDEPDFIGRGGALAELIALLGEQRCRLVTLLGPGGVGKSALALALLRHGDLLACDGLHWIALEDLADATALPLRIARELGVRVGARGDGWDEVLAALRDRHTVLVLDNAEHLSDLPAQVARLLAALPRLRLLVTSRQRLQLADEWVMRLAPLDEDAARRLFVAAARRAPAREPIDAAAPTLAELVGLLGRLPLALRLAAAWTRHLSMAAVLQQLRASLDLLQTDDAIDEHPAHRSLQATFAHSWALLDDAQGRRLAALSVGTGSMHMTVALATAEATPAQLAALADASLIALEASGRVNLHPLLRRFAQSRLDADARGQALARHAQALAGLLGPVGDFDRVDATEALAVIAPERQQIEQAWDTALGARRMDWLAALAPPWSELVQAQGGADGALKLLARAQPLLTEPDAPLPAARCDVALAQAPLLFWRGEHDACERVARLALATARSARLARPQRQALNVLALVAMRRGHMDRAARLMVQALAQARRAGETREVAIMAGNLCGMRRELGDLDAARTLAEESLQAHRAGGHAIGESMMLAELSMLAHLQGRLDDADAFGQQALQVSERHAMVMRRATILLFQASIRIDQQRLDDAAALLARAEADMQGGDAPHHHEATLRRLQAEVAIAGADMAAARARLRAACLHQPPLAASVNARGVLWSLAVFAAAQGDPALAAVLGERAERGRPPRTAPLPRYVALRRRQPLPRNPVPDDGDLQRAIDRLLT